MSISARFDRGIWRHCMSFDLGLFYSDVDLGNMLTFSVIFTKWETLISTVGSAHPIKLQWLDMIERSNTTSFFIICVISFYRAILKIITISKPIWQIFFLLLLSFSYHNNYTTHFEWPYTCWKRWISKKKNPCWHLLRRLGPTKIRKMERSLCQLQKKQSRGMSRLESPSVPTARLQQHHCGEEMPAGEPSAMPVGCTTNFIWSTDQLPWWELSSSEEKDAQQTRRQRKRSWIKKTTREELVW